LPRQATRAHGAHIKDVLVKLLSYPLPLRLTLARRIINRLSLLSYQDRLAIGAIDRPHYGYCIFQAAKLARSLHYPKISIIEFGCGGGNGLLNAEMHIAEVMKVFPVDIELYGFDLGSGLPQPCDYRDMPHYFKAGLYPMERMSLERKLKRARLVIGDVKDNCTRFFRQYNPAPVGCMFHDLDFYSSTIDALSLFDAHTSYFLPRVFMYFDDIVGDDTWLCNDYTGERLSITEFNQNHRTKKICENYYIRAKYWYEFWSHQIYIYHDFEHPLYHKFIADNEQKKHQNFIKIQ
jgi:hypothetical protein